MGSSKKKKVESKFLQQNKPFKNKIIKNKKRISKPGSMQQVLQCLQNRCSVEVDNIEYVLNGRKHISLSELPEWYYADETCGFDSLSQGKDAQTNIDARVPERPCSHVDFDDKPASVHAETLDFFDIKIVDTFSLAKSQNILPAHVDDSENAVKNVGFNHSKAVDSYHGVDNLMLSEDVHSPKSFSTDPGTSLPTVKIEKPDADVGMCAFQSSSTVSLDEVKSIFHSPTLDSLLAMETKKLEKNLDSLLERLNSSSKTILYNTPSSQASYVKTLQTALYERNKVAAEKEKKDSLLRFCGSSPSYSDIGPSKNIRASPESDFRKSKLLHNVLPKESHSSKCQKPRISYAKLVQRISRDFAEFALTAIHTDISSNVTESSRISSSFHVSSNVPTSRQRGTAAAIKKRLSRVSTYDSNNFDQVSDCFEAGGDVLKSSNKAKEPVVSQIKILPSLYKYKHVALNKKAEKLLVQKISDTLAQVAVAALNMEILRKYDFRKIKKNRLSKLYPFKGVKVLKLLRRKVKCLKPLSLKQVFSKYLLYKGRRWRSEKLCREYTEFSFSDLPVTLSKHQDQSTHFKLRLATHKLRWEEYPTSRGMVIFPESYSAADETLMHVSAEKCASNVPYQTMGSMTCARALSISCHGSLMKKKPQNKKVPMHSSILPANLGSTFTMDNGMSFNNMLGSVMVVQLSHAKKKNCNMLVKIMSFCEWGETAEQIMNIIVENHYELQNMQRGRYIRTVMSGFLIEVLRATSTQVVHKNMPAAIQKDILLAPSQDISLVKVSSNDSTPTENLDAKRLINFSEAIDSMLKLDKKLASRQSGNASKAKFVMLKQKQDQEKSKKKKTVQAEKNSKSCSSSDSASMTTVVTTCNTSTTSSETLSHFETMLKNLVEKQHSTQTTATTSVTTEPLILSSMGYDCSSLSTVVTTSNNLSYQVGKIGCLNSQSGSQLFGPGISKATTAKPSKQFFATTAHDVSMRSSASSSSVLEPGRNVMEAGSFEPTCSIIQTPPNPEIAISTTAPRIEPTAVLTVTSLADETISTITDHTEEVISEGPPNTRMAALPIIQPVEDAIATVTSHAEETVSTVTSALSKGSISSTKLSSSTGTCGEMVPVSCSPATTIAPVPSSLSQMQTYIAIPVRLVNPVKSSAATSVQVSSIALPVSLSNLPGKAMLQVPTTGSHQTLNRSLQPTTSKVEGMISFNVVSGAHFKAQGGCSAHSKLVSAAKTSVVYTSALTPSQPVIRLASTKRPRKNQQPAPCGKVTYSFPMLVKKKTSPNVLSNKDSNPGSEKGKTAFQSASDCKSPGGFLLPKTTSNSIIPPNVVLQPLSKNFSGTLMSSSLKGIQTSVRLGSPGALQNASSGRNIVKRKLNIAKVAVSSVNTSDGSLRNKTKPMKRPLVTASASEKPSCSGGSTVKRRKKKTSKICYVVSEEEAKLLKRVCGNPHIIQTCNMWNMTAQDLMKIMKNLCKNETTPINREEKLWHSFTEAMRSRNKLYNLLLENKKTVEAPQQIFLNPENGKTGASSTSAPVVHAGTTVALSLKNLCNETIDISRVNDSSLAQSIQVNDDATKLVGQEETMVSGDEIDVSGPADDLTWEPSEDESSEMLHLLRNNSRCKDIPENSDCKVVSSPDNVAFSRKGSRKTIRSKLLEQYDCDEVERCYRQQEKGEKDEDSDNMLKIRSNAEKQRRHRMKQSFAKLRQCLRFGPREAVSKMAILTQALIEIKFLNLERKNLSQVDDIVKRLNRNLQLYYLQLALSDDYEKDKVSLEDLKKTMKIVEDKERLIEVERQHQIESMRLLKVKEAELKKVALLKPSSGSESVKVADYYGVDVVDLSN